MKKSVNRGTFSGANARWLLMGIMLLLIVCSQPSMVVIGSTTDMEHQTEPVFKNGDEAWRIGYVETDPYLNFAGTFQGLLKGLEDLGWLNSLEGLPFEDGQVDSKVMWEWLAEQETGPYLKFVEDAHYSLIDLDDSGKEQMIKRFQEEQDLDLILALGTSAGKTVATDAHDIPTLVFSSSNAVRSGIIDSEHDSGMDHIWAHMDANRYKRQIEVFHDIFQYDRLGMVHDNSDLGRVYAAAGDVEQMAEELDFELVARHVAEPSDELDQERYLAEIQAAFEQVAQEVDAFYLTAGTWQIDQLPELLAPFYEAGVPVFSQIGQKDVEYGALMSLYRADFDGIGYFGADTISQVLRGAKPRELSQIYGDTPSIVLNLESANRIGYRIPFDILLVADQIFANIEGE
ncbi:ABC transporter substrate-binding protein [Marinicrinis sediminis]|uniref:ABC transporter substrate-binding protein n=1 Tax=Marinicrinis sediminis TaxID=1652465 RepID=A0ABW5RE28_9BACL